MPDAVGRPLFQRALDDVLKNHGDEALGFAAERLFFCVNTSFSEGEALWRQIYAELRKQRSETEPPRVGQGLPPKE